MFVRKIEGRKTTTGAMKKNCLGHNQSNQECGAGQQLTPSADLTFAAERLQSHIEAAAAATGTGHPLCQKVTESDP